MNKRKNTRIDLSGVLVCHVWCSLGLLSLCKISIFKNSGSKAGCVCVCIRGGGNKLYFGKRDGVAYSPFYCFVCLVVF